MSETRARSPGRGAWARRLFGVAMLIGLGCVAWGFLIEPRRLVEVPYTLALPGWPAQCDGLRVDAVADLHTGSPHNGVANLDRLVQRLIASDSDAVFMAGDYLSQGTALGRFVPAATIADHLRPLTARKPVYAVLGNHDWWDDGPRVRAALESAGVVVLENQARAVDLDGCRLWIAGIGDYWEGSPDPARAYSTIDSATPGSARTDRTSIGAAAITANAPVLALTHNPDIFPDMPARAALVVAGHTHGGQVNLPLLGRLIVPSKYDDRYAIGHIVEQGRHLFVTPGVGTSILPVRFGVPPEISRLTLRRRGVRGEE